MEIDWQQILSDHGPTVWKSVRCLVGNDADARDAYQNTFVAALQFSQGSKVEDWNRLLRRFARLRAIDLLRQRYRHRDRVESGTPMETAISDQPGPESQLIVAELSEQLRFALTRLTEQQAEAFVMRYVEELSYDEIAQRTNSNRNAVGGMLSRARKQLRLLLDPDHDSAPDSSPTSEETSS